MHGNQKYPDKRWASYWCNKRLQANRGTQGHSHNGQRKRYPPKGFDLTYDEINELIESFPVKGEYPSNKGWQLGRIDHNKGYTKDNVKWEWYTENIREMQKRVRYDETIPIRCEHAFSYPLV